MKPLSLLFFFFLTLSILLAIHPVSTQTLIDSSCESFARSDPNINYAFCTTSLNAAPASACAALAGLGSISIRLVRYNVTDTRCHIKQLLKNTALAPDLRKLLRECFELYETAIADVKQAMRYYKAKSFDDAGVKVTAIMDGMSTCEDTFKERPDVASPLRKRNHDAFQLSAVALSIMSLIRRGSG